jgi:hypothetical protein
MRRFGLVGALLVGLLSVMLLRPALAAETVTLDFDHEGTTDAAYTLDHSTALGTGRSGNGAFDDVYEIGGFGEAYFVTVTITLPEDCTVTDVSFWAKHTKVANNTIAFQLAFDGADFSEIWTPTVPYDTWTQTSAAANSITLSEPATSITIQMAFADPGNTTATAAIDDIAIECDGGGGGGLTRPLAAADEQLDWGIYDYDYLHSLNSVFDTGQVVKAFSHDFGANVAAVASGTVLSVTPYTSDSCADALIFENLSACYVAIPGELTSTSFSQIYALDMVGNWLVVVEDALDSSVTYSYVVNSPTVQVGDEVAAGCILGHTVQLKVMPFGLLVFTPTVLGVGISGGLGFVSEPTNAGVTFVTKYVDAAIASLLPSLTEQPSLADCQEQQLSACINMNPNLTSFAYYQHETDVTLLDGGGVTMPSFNYILQNDIMIDPDADYILSVQARKRETGDDTDHSTMNLQLGSELQSFEVEGAYHNYTFTPATEDWHTDNLTSIFVSNQPSSVAPIEIRYICLAPVTASTAPGSCYFANNEFDADASGWDVSATTFGTGQAFMRDGATLGQVVTLMPDDESTSHFYTIRAVVRLIATGSYTGQIGKSVSLNYEYPALTDGEVGTVDSTLVAEQGKNIVSGNVEYDYPYTLETTIEVSTETTSTFTFSVDVTDTDNYIQGLRVDSVCIDPSGDGTFPGQTGGGGFTPPFIVGCSVVPNPTENSIGPWIFYHWANLRRFFNCDLMKLLNKWFNLFDQFRITVLKVMRYWIAAVHHVSKWATSFLWWLNGHFGNIAQGQVTTITEAGGCHDIFCAIVDVTTTLGNLLTPIVEALNNVVNVLVGVFIGVVNLFFTLVGGLVAFVVALIIKLMNFIGIAVGLLVGIVGAYNGSTPTAIPGLPSCAIDPSSSPFCYAVWVADNTIFQGRWNTLFNVLLSIAAIHLILYTVREIKSIVMQTWSSS